MLDFVASFFAGLKPEEKLSVSDWADKYRYLSQKSSAEPGKWRTDRTPYLRAIFDALSTTSPIQRVVFMAGAQIGKTEAGLCWLGYVMHHSPGPVMLVQPTLDMAKRLSKQRLAPMIEETPVLKDLIPEARSRDSGNTMLMKDFPGGFMVLVGSNSDSGLKSMPVRYCFIDEVDSYPIDVNDNGDPIQLAERRTTSFGSKKKIYIVSTPTIKDTSLIEKAYKATNQQKFYVPCPYCGHMDWIKWDNIKWENNDPKTAKLKCIGCETLIDERFKTEMLLKGQWMATTQGNEKSAGFHLSSLYSPLGWKSWEEIVEEFLASKDDPPRLKEWVNTVLAETWEEDYSSKIGTDELSSRAEPYRMNTVPMGGLLMTAGVDVQDNRIAVTVKAWGNHEETWLVSWQEIYGDPSDLSVNGPWQQLDNILKTQYIRDDGVPLKIKSTAIDTGHFTHEVYMYCRSRKNLGVIAIKGGSVLGKPALSKPSKQDVNYKGQHFKNGVELWTIGTDTVKTTIFSRLRRPLGQGQATFHFPAGLPDEYYNQLTAEKQINVYKNGVGYKKWVPLKDGIRNEALDCEVYSFVALQYLYTKYDRNTIWLQAQQIIDKMKPEKELVKQEDVIENKEQSDSEPVVTTPVTPPPQPPPVRRPAIRRNTGFVTSWRR